MCRLCGNRAQTLKEKRKGAAVHPVSQFAVEIELIIGLEVRNDDENVCSGLLCTKCYNLLINLRKRGRSSIHDALFDHMFQINDTVWTRYNPSLDLSQCTVCSLVSSQAKSGRPKVTKPGLGADYNKLHDKFSAIVKGIPRFNTSQYEIFGLTPAQQKHYICPLCEHVLSLCCVTYPCGHDFCSSCLSAKVEGNKSSVLCKCPECNVACEMQTVKATKWANSKFFQQLEILGVKCNKCHIQGPLHSMTQHEYEMCQPLEPHTSLPEYRPLHSRNVTINETEVHTSGSNEQINESNAKANAVNTTQTISGKHVSAPDSKRTVADDIKAMIKKSDDNIIRIPTGGQVSGKLTKIV